MQRNAPLTLRDVLQEPCLRVLKALPEEGRTPAYDLADKLDLDRRTVIEALETLVHYKFAYTFGSHRTDDNHHYWRARDAIQRWHSTATLVASMAND